LDRQADGWLGIWFKLMLLAAGIFYFIAMLMRLSMAREAAKNATTNTDKLSFAGLKINLRVMFALVFSGGLITWMLVTDGMRDISFQFSENLFPVYMQEVGGLSLQQIGWVMSFFGIAMMATTILGGLCRERVGSLGYLNVSALFVLVNVPWQSLDVLFGLGYGRGVSAPRINLDQQGCASEKSRHGIWFV
jgi:predicted MFS family arabinose efflux permease